MNFSDRQIRKMENDLNARFKGKKLNKIEQELYATKVLLIEADSEIKKLQDIIKDLNERNNKLVNEIGELKAYRKPTRNKKG